MIPSSSALLAWYDHNRRVLPWRALPGQAADPYHVWISEIMLQQTTVTAVVPYYHAFLARFPTVERLAAAPLDDVLAAWAGLGYYSRARNLHRCAGEIVQRGGFPRDVEGLQALPGIGPYTASAIAAIAFGMPVVPVDGNVERIVARVFAIEEPLPGARRKLGREALRLNGETEARNRPSDFAQALFDLGATVCVPRTPQCLLCPWVVSCAAHKAGIQVLLPAKTPKAARPERHGVHFLLVDEAGQIVLRRRPDKGLLGGTIELPGTPWQDAPWPLPEAFELAPGGSRHPWRVAGTVRHVFSHFALMVTVCVARVRTMPNLLPEEGFVVPAVQAEGLALSSLMRKCLGTGLEALGNEPAA